MFPHTNELVKLIETNRIFFNPAMIIRMQQVFAFLQFFNIILQDNLRAIRV